MNLLDKTSHLAKTNEEVQVTDFELQLWRVFYGFIRWQQECEHNVNGTNLMGEDLSVLHIIRMKDRPKSVPEIARLLNRNDNFNIQYSIRKLLKTGLIQKAKLPDSKQAAYITTQTGILNTDKMAIARKNILINAIKNAGLQLVETTQMLMKLKALYEEAEHTAASCINRNEE